MTLVARAKPPRHHKKVAGKHHRQNKDYHKAYWPYLPMLAIVAAGLFLNTAWNPKNGVLGYATDMSVQSLLNDTNNDRTSNGLSSVSLNSLLVQAAQNKANDMASRDYWSHNTPDGQTPWSFYTAVGYSYQTAGENLAYGFTTASDTEVAWMNSPEHRANILNTTYQEVGFGVANSPNYQGSGPETIVVAEFAKPASAPVAAATTPAPAVPAPVTQTISGQAGQSAAGGDAAASPDAIATPTPAATSTTADSSAAKNKTAVLETKPQTISRVQLLTAGKLPWSGFVVSIIAATGLLLIFMRHGIAWHKVIRKGEKFVLKHRLLDVIVLLVVIAGYLLTRSSGIIR